MSFTSWAFIGLCVMVSTIYYLPICRRGQPQLLVVASLVFYALGAPNLLWLLIMSVLMNAVVSWLIVNRPSGEKLAWTTIGVTANVFILIYFKYASLLAQLLAKIVSASPATIPPALLLIPLPIGISFYTFEGISLVTDIFRGRDESAAEAALSREVAQQPFSIHLMRTSLFIIFYPHLASGPILRAAEFMPQIGRRHFKEISWNKVARTLILGFFLKMVVANNLAEYTQWLVYPRFTKWGGLTNFTLLCSALFRLFADFAGYSYIAIGIGLLFGYQLPVNFDRPFLSASITEFWMRWHISLSSWLRDYLYKPLRGSSGNFLRADLSLLAVLMIGGIWHGAEWHYLGWGAYLGLAMLVERQWLRRKTLNRTTPPARPSPFRVLVTFLFCVSSMLWFQLPNIRTVKLFIVTLSHPFSHEDVGQIVTLLLYCMPVVFYHLVRWEAVGRWMQHRWNTAARPVQILNDFSYGAMLALIIVNHGDTHPFIYFKF